MVTAGAAGEVLEAKPEDPLAYLAAKVNAGRREREGRLEGRAGAGW